MNIEIPNCYSVGFADGSDRMVLQPRGLVSCSEYCEIVKQDQSLWYEVLLYELSGLRGWSRSKIKDKYLFSSFGGKHGFLDFYYLISIDKRSLDSLWMFYYPEKDYSDVIEIFTNKRLSYSTIGHGRLVCLVNYFIQKTKKIVNRLRRASSSFMRIMKEGN